jgi:hypothetical protein
MKAVLHKGVWSLEPLDKKDKDDSVILLAEANQKIAELERTISQKDGVIRQLTTELEMMKIVSLETPPTKKK